MGFRLPQLQNRLLGKLDSLKPLLSRQPELFLVCLCSPRLSYCLCLAHFCNLKQICLYNLNRKHSFDDNVLPDKKL